MDSWRDLAAQILAKESAPPASTVEPVEAGRGEARQPATDAPATAAPHASLPGVQALPLPAHVASGLAALATMGHPARLARGGPWAEVVDDAQRLARDGWASKAIGLGWDPLELFGIGRRSSASFEGLAVWLAGAPVVLLDSSTAIARLGTSHRVFTRRPAAAATDRVVFLWEFGRLR